ncbi:MAG: hypothetical protein AAB432_02660 [Patescibacteria group bacterium]
MRPSTKRILSVTLATVFLIGSLTVYFNFIKDEASSISDKRAIIASKTSLYNNQKQAVSEVKGLINQFQNVSRLEETISLAMPDGAEPVQALRQIEAVSATNNVTLASLDFTASTPRGAPPPFIKKLGTLAVTLKANGGYEGLKKFLAGIETSVRLANVAEFSFTPATLKNNIPDSLTLKVNMFYQE